MLPSLQGFQSTQTIKLHSSCYPHFRVSRVPKQENSTLHATPTSGFSEYPNKKTPLFIHSHFRVFRVPKQENSTLHATFTLWFSEYPNNKTPLFMLPSLQGFQSTQTIKLHSSCYPHFRIFRVPKQENSTLHATLTSGFSEYPNKKTPLFIRVLAYIWKQGVQIEVEIIDFCVSKVWYKVRTTNKINPIHLQILLF